MSNLPAMQPRPLRAQFYLNLCALTFGVVLSCATVAQNSVKRVEGVLVVVDCRKASVRVLANSPQSHELAVARECVKMGAPLAVLMGTGDEYVLYTLALSPPTLAEFIAEHVIVEGVEMAPRVLLPERIRAKVKETWIDVPITSVM